jgi:predicted NBD/HSP70 family sugar kinase
MESGIGGGIIVDGTLLRGAHGLAGEIGHLRGPGGDPGRTLEAIIGLEGMKAAYRDAGGPPGADFARLVRDVRDRVPAAVTVAEKWAKTLAFGLVEACRIVDPDRIVLGGSGAALYPLVASRLAAHMASAQAESFPMPGISVYEEAAFGAAFGAACMMHQKYLSLESQRYADEPPAAPGQRDEIS